MSGLGQFDVARYFVAGIALGAFYFILLLRTVRLHASQAAVSQIIPLYLLRFVMVVTTFWFIAQQGTAPLLLALLGFVMARFIIQHWTLSE